MKVLMMYEKPRDMQDAMVKFISNHGAAVATINKPRNVVTLASGLEFHFHCEKEALRGQIFDAAIVDEFVPGPVAMQAYQRVR